MNIFVILYNNKDVVFADFLKYWNSIIVKFGVKWPNIKFKVEYIFWNKRVKMKEPDEGANCIWEAFYLTGKLKILLVLDWTSNFTLQIFSFIDLWYPL